jgi:hypothetical protein
MQDVARVETRLQITWLRGTARLTGLARHAALAGVLLTTRLLCAQSTPPEPAIQIPPATVAPPTAQAPQEPQAAGGAQTPQPSQSGDAEARPIAIVPLDSKIPGAAAEVTGGLLVHNGRAFIASTAVITSGDRTTHVTLPYRGTLSVCASTTVKLAADSSVTTGDAPGLLMALDHGAVEASFVTGQASDALLTPDFRILVGGPGPAEVKVRLGPNGDTCVDNAGTGAPYVQVSSVFDEGSYRVMAGQRVMFQHGSVHEVVDQEKEPCGCPAPPAAESNDFPLAQSEGLAPILHPAPKPVGEVGHEAETTGALVYNAENRALKPPEATAPTPAAAAPVAPSAAVPATPPAPPPAPKKKSGFFKAVGHFFRVVLGPV